MFRNLNLIHRNFKYNSADFWSCDLYLFLCRVRLCFVSTTVARLRCPVVVGAFVRFLAEAG
jgi:hypothetical protein